VSIDGFAVFFMFLIGAAVVLAALLADGYLRREGLATTELYVLILLSASGGLIMAAANDLIVLFLGLEILSISAYVLAAMHLRRNGVARSRHEVLHPRRVLVGVLPLRHRARVRRHRFDEPHPHLEFGAAHGDHRPEHRASDGERGPRCCSPDFGAAARGLRLQGCRRAVPLVDPRRVPKVRRRRSSRSWHRR